MRPRQIRALAVVEVLVLISTGTAMLPAAPWGMYGHEIAGRAAATHLPQQMPPFFRSATEQLAYLNAEPDRWRDANLRELNEAMRYDHYVNLEVVPAAVLASTDRFQYLAALQSAGIRNPASEAGLLPYRITELYQSLVTQWRLWRRERDPVKRGWIEQRIINDAGILGHFVTDGANPHHTSVHHDGWRRDVPNPRGFTTERGFHARFETQFVGARITLADLLPHVPATPRRLQNVRSDVNSFLAASHGRLERLYELDRAEAFGRATRGSGHRDFTVERLVAGSNMLRDLWWTAWLESAAQAGR
jgi:hypothetical protein